MTNRLIAIVGPTGVGKSKLALRLAEVYKGEVLNADSRLLYRYLDIGTAKPSAAEQDMVRHHLIDVAMPDEPITLAQYQEKAYHAIMDIMGRGKPPFLVGGSGLYVWAVIEGWSIPRVPPNLEWRSKAEKEELTHLNDLLATLAPVTAKRIDKHNPRRVIRAIEIAMASASPPDTSLKPCWTPLIVGLTCPREELYQRVDRRIQEMLGKGWLEEVEGLLARGYNLDLSAISAIGYRELALYLRGELGWEEVMRRIRQGTRCLVRKQYNWFRLTDRRIRWFDISQPESRRQVEALVEDFLARDTDALH